MDEDELLYREMNEEDPWYMGPDSGEYGEEESYDEGDEGSRRNAFLLFWRSESGNLSLEDYANAREQYGASFTLSTWPVDLPDNIMEGDRYYMVRLIEGQKGIVWHGTFTSDPYETEDGDFVDLIAKDAVKPNARPLVTLEEMKELTGEVEWESMESGQMITSELADLFDETAARNRYKESHPYRGYTSKEAYEENEKRLFQNDMAGCVSIILLVLFCILVFAWILS